MLPGSMPGARVASFGPLASEQNPQALTCAPLRIADYSMCWTL